MSFTVCRQKRGVWVLLTLILAACSREDSTPSLETSYLERVPQHPNVVVSAPRQLIGATVTIDTGERRRLWPDTLIERSQSGFWRGLFDLDERKPNAAKVYLELVPGKRSLLISHDQFEPIVKIIEVGGEQQHVRVSTIELFRKQASVEP